MIVWLASWPRSGNTLCRLIIEDCLGVKTYSENPEPEFVKIFGQKELEFARKLHDGTPDSYHDLYQEKQAYIVKTHRIIWDDSKVIWLHRDGRDAMASYAKFLALHIRQAMFGMGTEYCDWSMFYHGWNPLRRQNTLVINFSDMIDDPDGVAEQVGSFLGHPVLKAFENPQSEYKKIWPQMFNENPTDWRIAFGDGDIQIFWERHYEVMHALGYAA